MDAIRKGRHGIILPREKSNEAYATVYNKATQPMKHAERG